MYQISDELLQPTDLTINLKKTACHEIGHTIGFEHHPPAYYPDNPRDCMRSGNIGETLDWLRINDHHSAHINGYLANQ